MSFKKICTCCSKVLEKKDIVIWYNNNNCKSTLVTKIKEKQYDTNRF